MKIDISEYAPTFTKQIEDLVVALHERIRVEHQEYAGEDLLLVLPKVDIHWPVSSQADVPATPIMATIPESAIAEIDRIMSEPGTISPEAPAEILTYDDPVDLSGGADVRTHDDNLTDKFGE